MKRTSTGPCGVGWSALTWVFSFALMQGHVLAGDGFPVVSLKEMRERGMIMQQWESSCAAAAIATVLTYGFHDPVSERQAIVKMLEKTDPEKVRKRGGFSLLDLKIFVEERGYSGNAYRHLSLDDLSVFHAPVVPINQHGYNHYVVFNGTRDDRVYLADPSFGRRDMPAREFQELWMDGIAFVVTRPENH